MSMMRTSGGQAREVVNSVPPEKRLENDGIMSILGMGWDREKDTLSIRFKDNVDPSFVSLESALSAMASVYDPMGVCAPSMLEFKLLVQKGVAR